MVEAGTSEKGDVKVTIEPANEREIVIKSKLERIYGNAIRNTVEELTSGITAKIVVEDMGALDWVLRARMESALRKFRGEEQ
ncbi:MAG: citrate lyase acyl carrier protein [Euryarchaeota archaeon]|nr:citrate lyase acyl carrier protein [Euryarchaeota archaeon]